MQETTWGRTAWTSVRNGRTQLTAAARTVWSHWRGEKPGNTSAVWLTHWWGRPTISHQKCCSEQVQWTRVWHLLSPFSVTDRMCSRNLSEEQREAAKELTFHSRSSESADYDPIQLTVSSIMCQIIVIKEQFSQYAVKEMWEAKEVVVLLTLKWI